MTETETFNIAAALTDMAERAPYQPGVIFPAGRDPKGRAKTVQLNFQQLNAACDSYAHGLTALGIHPGERVLLLLRPGVELIAVVFALLKMGAVPVLIDPGMGTQAFLQCVMETDPSAVIGLPAAHFLRRLIRRPFRSVKHTVVATEHSRLNGVMRALADTTLDDVRSAAPTPFPIAPTTTESEAAIAFTSGSTGVPKGVIYHQGAFKAQIALLRDVIGIRPGEVDLALLYIFALFNPALGVTTIIPDMDPTKSAEVNPAYVVEAIQTYGVTNAFGSPTIWKRVAPYCQAHGLRLPSLKRVLMAGAPTPPDLIERMIEDILSEDADVNTPFGATEAMPLTTMSGREILAETAALTQAGKGMCVGRPITGLTVRIIEITDGPIADWDADRVLPRGEIGEIVVKGPVVTRAYVNRPDANTAAKIKEGTQIWHRMGDLGYLDERGRIWFCGRKAHRVTTPEGPHYPVLCEIIFNRHPDVARTALVGVGPDGQQEPVLVVEPEPGKLPRDVLTQQRMTMELLALGAEHAHTRPIQTVLFYPDVFPTDVRHNAKIQREKLAVWAVQQTRNGRSLADPEVYRDTGVTYTGRTRQTPRVGDLLGAIGIATGLLVSAWLLIKRLRGRR
jgi:olefin beta-lactone synthetase